MGSIGVIILLISITGGLALAWFSIKPKNKHQISKWLFLVLLFAGLSYYSTLLINPQTDMITITALAEKDAAPGGNEIWIKDISVDGKEIDIPTPSAGKWFWVGENYVWRNENDVRQPDGTTNTIELPIPVGHEREIRFLRFPWSGVCKISTSSEEQIINTYVEKKESNSVFAVQLEPSSNTDILLSQLKKIFAFISVFLFFIFFLNICTKIYQNASSSRKTKWLNFYQDHFVCAFIAGVTFVFMLFGADAKSMWSDELAQISFAMKGIQDNINYCLTMQDITPPLYNICCLLWYKIAPYGEKWLFLITIIPTSLAIYFIGSVCTKISDNKYAGILASILMATSSTVWIYQAYELRSYAFVLFFTTFTIYSHVMRRSSRKWEWIFSISLTLLAMCHYFAMIACGLFFLLDLYLLTKKQLTFWELLRFYLLPAIITISWLTAVFFQTLRYKNPEQIASWYVIPKIKDVRDLLFLLTGSEEFMYRLLFIGIALAVVLLISNKSNYVHNKQIFYCIFSAFSLVITILVLFIYGNFINSAATMWQQRYFLFLTPFVWILISTWIIILNEKLDQRLFGNNGICQKTVCLFMGIMLSINVFINAYNYTWPVQPYREAADWLYQQANEIYNDDTAIIVTSDAVRDGWYEYYLTKQGRRDPVNCYSQSEILNHDKDLRNYHTLYVQYSHVKVKQSFSDILTRDFDLQADHKNLNLCVYTRKI